ncbi:FMN-binding glutamate synthase family protein [Alicyclobacillus acidiphilus]|uniref:FMN-binding glutamate synthase family protein n=1 Tax=Alicyclobacillus acidiphilus TaxID=182455 RepID=UPI000A667CAF|nr:FMN-binding glutamate synthase family protein [Alicyclobacillus acidiphilus]
MNGWIMSFRSTAWSSSADAWIWMFMLSFVAWALVVLLTVLTSPFWLRLIIKKATGRATALLFTEPYTKNVLEGVTALRKVGLQWTVENELRAHTGTPLEKPIGTSRTFPHFDGLLFSSAQLHRRPLDHSVSIEMETVIGRRAKRPLVISMPVMVTGMGYGVALSKSFERAIAKGTSMVGTAFNTGQGPVLQEFRDLARHLVVQYHGAPWKPSAPVLRQADMVEIRFGQGANAGAGTVVSANGLNERVKRDLKMSSSDSYTYIPAGQPEVRRMHDLQNLIHRLRLDSDGAPIAVKLAAGHDIEQDIKIAVQAGADVLVIDGAQGGTHSSPAILVDDFGLPTLAALCRAVRFLEHSGYRSKVDLIISGGIRTPGDMLKALALGANAVYIGTAALFAVVHTQIVKVIPMEPPTQLAWANAELLSKFEEDEGAQSLARFLNGCMEEMKNGVRALGKQSVHDVNREDLVSYDVDVARITQLPLV